MAEERLEDIFDACIDMLRDGDNIDDCLRRYPAYADRLRPLLQTGVTVRGMRLSPAQISADQEIVWDRVQAQLAEITPQRADARYSNLLRGLLVMGLLGIVILVAVLVLDPFGGDDTNVIIASPEPTVTSLPSATATVTASATPSETATATVTASATPSETGTATATATVTSAPTTTPMATGTININGPVSAINNGTITVYGITVQLPPDDVVTFSPGDIVQVMGTVDGDTIIAVSVTVIPVITGAGDDDNDDNNVGVGRPSLGTGSGNTGAPGDTDDNDDDDDDD